MSEVVNPVPDFWGFLSEQEARLRREFSKVSSENELKACLEKWLDPSNGVLARIKLDPFFALARPSARRIFDEYMRDRISLEEKYCRDWILSELEDAN